MTLLPEDLSTCTVDELFGSQAENRTWSKELRLSNAALVNSRLSREITLDEYAAKRALAKEQTTECRRRSERLAGELQKRGGA